MQRENDSLRRSSRRSSIDSTDLQIDYKPWYSRESIRENICRDSIANSKNTRRIFESGQVWRGEHKIDRCHVYGSCLLRYRYIDYNRYKDYSR